LRKFLFPVLRQTYDDLLDAATKPVRADLLLLGELNYAGPLVAEVTGIAWASYVLAPLSFFSAFDPPVLPMYPRLARADKKVPGMGRAIRRLARFVSRKWPDPIYALRNQLGLPKARIHCLMQALAEPGAGTVFACAGVEAERLAAEDADYRIFAITTQMPATRRCPKS